MEGVVAERCIMCGRFEGHVMGCIHAGLGEIRPAADNPISPSHYSRFAIQPIEFILANKLSFLQASVLKYLCRYPYKNGMEDLLKCRDMLNRLIAEEEKLVVAAKDKGQAVQAQQGNGSA